MPSEQTNHNMDAVLAPVSGAQLPRMHQVIFVNDNVTTMEFVVETLVSLFGHALETAAEITLKIHNEGFGVAGIYTKDIADAKSDETFALARSKGYPLSCKIEPIIS